MSHTKTTRSVGAALRPISGAYRRRIKAAFLLAHGVGALNDDRRRALEACIFAEQNELEHRSPRHPQVEVMNAVRCVLLDDLGSTTPGYVVDEGNEVAKAGLRWPHVEAVAARMAPRRKERSQEAA